MHTRTVLGGICGAALACGIASCGSNRRADDDDASGSGAAGTTSSTTSSSVTTGAGGEEPCGADTTCAPPEPTQPNDMSTVGVVTAQVIDHLGAPAANVNAAVCGINVCGDITNSDTNGNLSVDGQSLEYVAPRFSVGYNGKGYTKLLAPPTSALGTIRVVRIPPFAMGVDLVPGRAAQQSGVTLTIPAGAEVTYDSLTFAPEEQRFVAAVADIRGWNLPAEAPGIDPSLEVIIALGPLDTHICPSAALEFPNVASWPPNSPVEIHIHGTKTYEHYAPYGSWAKVADARVSADGMSVATVECGIEVLGTYGARLR